MKHFLLTAAISFLVSGCATKTYLPEKPPSKEYGKVTIIREYAEPTAFAIYTFLDDIKAAAVYNYSHATFSVPLGEHRLKLDWPKTASATEFETKINVTEYSEHYYYVSQNIEVSNFSFLSAAVIGYISYDVSENLYVAKITPTQAEEILSKIKLGLKQSTQTTH